MEPLRKRGESVGVKLLDPPPGFDSNGLWFCDPDNILIEVNVAAKTLPNDKMSFEMASTPAGERNAPYRRDRGR